MITGILAFHGDVAEHAAVLDSLRATWMEVRTLEDLKAVERLIIPGGESTVISRFLRSSGIALELKQRVKKGFPVFGTCAGSIVLARRITGGPGAEALSLIDIDIDRNAYGTQLDSFTQEFLVKGLSKSVKAAFIRAPIVTRIGKSVEVLASVNRDPVIVQEGNVLAATCHPEMCGETALHRLFLTL